MKMNDHESRLAALHPEKSVVVRAPAGSGKTSVLTLRLLRLLATVSKPEEIVAVTFTRKAAAEMKRRVVEALIDAKEKPEPTDPYQRQMWEMAREVLKRDHDHEWAILDHPARLNIQTLDSFCYSLVSAMPYLSRFGGDLRIVDDAKRYYGESAMRTAERLYSHGNDADDIGNLLAYCDNHHERLVSLLARMLETRDQWERMREEYGHHDSLNRDVLETALQTEVETQLTALDAHIPHAIRDEIIEVGRGMADVLIARGNVDVPISRLATVRAWPSADADAWPVWCALADMLLTSKGGWRQKWTIDQGVPTKKEGGDVVRGRLNAIVRSLQENANAESRLAMVRSLPPVAYTDTQWHIIELMARVLDMAIADWNELMSREGIVDFIAISQAAQRALGSDDEPTDLLLRLDYRIRHMLVDEFQDTSKGQIRLLELLTSGFEPGDGRTLFLVGDPMQSIYRFRYAEVGLFLRAMIDGVGGQSLEGVNLQRNFRSSPTLVEWVNTVFSRLLPDEIDWHSGAVPFSHADAARNADAESAISLDLFCEGDEWGEADRVVDIIRHEQTRNPTQSMAILIRSRSHLRTVAKALLVAGISYHGYELEKLSDRPVIQWLLALTRAIYHLGDRLAWMAVLRAPWCGLTLSDLLVVANEKTGTLWSYLSRGEWGEDLSEDGADRLRRVVPVLRMAIEQRGEKPMRRLIEACWMSLGGPLMVDSSERADADAFFDLVERAMADHEADPLDALSQWVDERYSQPPAPTEGGVHVMTIHRAKGLEFDTVIIPGMGNGPQHDKTAMMNWIERFHGLLVAPIEYEGEKALSRYLASLHKEKAKHEQDRLLYVAVTRAKRRLYMTGCGRVEESDDATDIRFSSGSFLHRLKSAVPTLVADAAMQMRAPSTDAHVVQQNQTPTFRRLRRDVTWPSLPKAVDWTRMSERAASEREERASWQWREEDDRRHIGTVTHAMLERMADMVENTDFSASLYRNHIESLLRREGLSDAGLPAAIETVVALINHTITDEKGRWILGRHADAACEVKLSGVVDGTMVHAVIDRTFVDGDTRWIIDYKTAAPAGQSIETFITAEWEMYRSQLETYAALYRAMEPDRLIRLGLYFPAIQGWKEWGVDGSC